MTINSFSYVSGNVILIITVLSMIALLMYPAITSHDYLILLELKINIVLPTLPNLYIFERILAEIVPTYFILSDIHLQT